MTHGRARGFTLIELMIAVAVIGLLASIAIPSFQLMQFRAKQAERAVIMAAMVHSIDELWARDGRFPDVAGTDSWLWLTYDQPDFTPTTRRQGWRYTAVDPTDHWNLLSITVEGGVYYRYGGWARTTGNQRIYHLYAYGDLDGDGVQNRWTKEWYYVNGVRQTVTGGTLDCSDCSIGFESNPGAL
jgi:prepilin-type N-terminal cleavage/methylation domain-containing protein